MDTIRASVGYRAAAKILERIEALPLVRRRGRPLPPRGPVYLGATEKEWVKSRRLDMGGALLRLAANAAVFVTYWQLRTSYYLSSLNDREEWVRHIRDFDKTFPEKPRYQLIEVLEAVVHEHMDLPTVPVFPYKQLLPEWREVDFGELALVHEIRPRMCRLLIHVRDGQRQSVEILVEDYGGSKLIEVCTGENGLGVTYFSSRYEQQHVLYIKGILDYLAEKGVISSGVYESRIDELLKHTSPNSPAWEQ